MEIEQAATCYAAKYRISTIFIGGGTPSFISPELIEMIMNRVKSLFSVDADAEISMEMNPGTLGMNTAATSVRDDNAMRALEIYRRAGINRISIGLQSADDKALKEIGRIHTYEDFLKTYDEVRTAGFDNVNIDLMAALPDQSYEGYMDSLSKAIALSPEHLSCYSLILEEGTPLYENQEKYSFPDEDTERKMYHDTVKVLKEAGYGHYEISNFAKPGRECRHNIVYWRRGDYLGLGLGASSCMNETRFKNPADMKLYEKMVNETDGYLKCERGKSTNGMLADNEIAEVKSADGKFMDSMNEKDNICTGLDFPRRPYLEEYQKLTEKDRIEETFFVGLRMMEGVDTEGFIISFGKTIEEVYGELPQKLIAEGLLERHQDHISLTPYGIDISNYVMAQFIFDE